MKGNYPYPQYTSQVGGINIGNPYSQTVYLQSQLPQRTPAKESSKPKEPTKSALLVETKPHTFRR